MEPILHLLAAGFVGLALGAAFMAAFKTGKREARVDAELQKVIDNPKLPAVLRQLAQKAKDLELQKAALALKGDADDFEARVRAAVEKIQAGK